MQESLQDDDEIEVQNIIIQTLDEADSKPNEEENDNIRDDKITDLYNVEVEDEDGETIKECIGNVRTDSKQDQDENIATLHEEDLMVEQVMATLNDF